MSGSQLFCVKHLRESLLTSPSASPCSLTGGCHAVLAFIGHRSVVCCHQKNIDLSPLFIISRLNCFTFVTALLLPILRLELMLPLYSQGLGTGGWLPLTRQAYPAVFYQLTKTARAVSGKQPALFSQFALHFTLYHNGVRCASVFLF